MSTTFDYETAWWEVARPAYEGLPTEVHRLLGLVAVRCAELHQLPGCSMPWPDAENMADSLQREFEEMPIDVLAYAAQVIYNTGYWWPGKVAGDCQMPGREVGAHWKFAHYADQTLRAKLGLPARGTNGCERGYGYAVHEGVIRVTYSDNNSWNWFEVAPATLEGLEKAKRIVSKIRIKVAAAMPNRRYTTRGNNARYLAFEEYRIVKEWPSPEWAAIADMTPYMIDEGVIKQRHAARMPAPDRAKLRARMIADVDSKVEKLRAELAGFLWVFDAGLPTDNLIYYGHRGVFTFGWQSPVSTEFKSQLLDALVEFPYAYEIKAVDGTVSTIAA